jgi:UPF0716 protein FxsA
MLDAAFLVFAGTLLLIPGFLTDIAAGLLLIPPLRRAIATWAIARLLGGGGRPRYQPRGHAPKAPLDDGMVIEGEFERIDETEPRTTAPPRRGAGKRDAPS